MENDGRVRLLRILKILRECTDGEHPISTAKLEKLLREEYNLDAYYCQKILISIHIMILWADGRLYFRFQDGQRKTV